MTVRRRFLYLKLSIFHYIINLTVIINLFAYVLYNIFLLNTHYLYPVQLEMMCSRDFSLLE